MTKSPLQFARDFARLQGQLAALPAGDGQLLLALDFWQEMREYWGDAAYQSYFDEYLPLLSRLSDKGNLVDLTIAELTALRDVLAEFDSEKSQIVAVELAKQYFYVGAIEDGCAALPSPPTSLPLGEGQAVGQNPLGFDDAVQNEFAALQTVCARASEINHPHATTLNGILTDWQAEREAVYHDRARCLFVERDDAGSRVRGRMRTLVGRIELFGKSARTDEITFDNVIKTPDDRFVGVAYEACAAVRGQFRVTGLGNQGSHYYHAHYSIENSGQTFTGDSIGLAFGLLAYVQLLRPEVLWLDRLLSGEVAFTGGVDSEGRLTAVNSETLGQKIERAFFSPVKYLVLPETNAAAARNHLDLLRNKYPRRHLHLITADRLSDVIEDHNIVRSEKVCIGELVAKKAAKYGRMTKVQVPLLLVLAYLLVCLLYPKEWVGFDWNPSFVRPTADGFSVCNGDSCVLWSQTFDCRELVTGLRNWAVADLDGNGKNEVLFMPAA